MKLGLTFVLVSFLCVVSNAHEFPSDVLDSPDANVLVGGYSSANPQDAFGELSIVTAVSELKSTGLSILSSAYNRTSSASYQNIYSALYSGLSGATIHAPPSGQDFNGCSANTLAFVMVAYPNHIYLCARLWNNHSSTGYYMAQTLIHESAHTRAVYNECTATTYEVSAMRVSGVGLAYQNGYMSNCGIE